MKGDSIVIEPHHARAAESVQQLIGQRPGSAEERLVVSVAGESGAGKSEVAEALARLLNEEGYSTTVLQQDDYFVHPPRSNDRVRREDIGWVGPSEVRLDLMEEHLELFRARACLTKPLVRYLEDRIDQVNVDLSPFQIAIVEGTYVTLLKNVDVRVFIDRDYHASRAHREKRRRHASELDPFIDQVLAVEHGIIAPHRMLADIVI
ncbi:MAG: adenylyl-sulfate kinase, partial [Wenzhouxiangella sp.]|nr:adenylyl-sulfate kinase [Wenzhouxiangella sp.]